MTSTSYLTPDVLAADLAVRDLTDPGDGPHAIQLIVQAVLDAVTTRWGGGPVVERGERIVEVADNYDRLGYGRDATARDARYTRYVDDRHRSLHKKALRAPRHYSFSRRSSDRFAYRNTGLRGGSACETWRTSGVVVSSI